MISVDSSSAAIDTSIDGTENVQRGRSISKRRSRISTTPQNSRFELNVNPPNYVQLQGGVFRCTNCESEFSCAKTRNEHELSTHNFQRSDEYLMREEEAEPNYSVSTPSSPSLCSEPDVEEVPFKRLKAEETDSQPELSNEVQETSVQLSIPTNEDRTDFVNLHLASNFSCSNLAVLLTVLLQNPTVIYYDFQSRGSQVGTYAIEHWKSSPCKLLLLRLRETEWNGGILLGAPFYRAHVNRLDRPPDVDRESHLVCWCKKEAEDLAFRFTADMNLYVTFEELILEVIPPLGSALVIADNSDLQSIRKRGLDTRPLVLF